MKKDWLMGNIAVNSWVEIARSRIRHVFAAQKAATDHGCHSCEYQTICRGGCPKLRYPVDHRFERPDYFCATYKMILGTAGPWLAKELGVLMKSKSPDPLSGAAGSVSPD